MNEKIRCYTQEEWRAKIERDWQILEESGLLDLAPEFFQPGGLDFLKERLLKMDPRWQAYLELPPQESAEKAIEHMPEPYRSAHWGPPSEDQV